MVPSPCSCGVPGEACGATCTNTAPSYFCTCANGFQLRSGGKICDGNLLGFECFRLGNPEFLTRRKTDSTSTSTSLYFALSFEITILTY